MKEQPDKATTAQPNSAEVREEKSDDREKDTELIRALIGLMKESRRLE
jgi:hypothetical protein